MELKEYIAAELIGLERSKTRVLESLTQQEIAWRPAPACNSIGLILFHIARTDDSFLLPTLSGQKEIWNIDKWCDKLGLPVTESGSQYSAEQVNSFCPPPLEDIAAYSQAVGAKILTRIQEMKPDEFDKKITLPFFGETNIASVIALMISHTAQHLGEISYLRGLQRGLDK